MKVVKWLAFGFLVLLSGCTSLNSPKTDNGSEAKGVTIFYQSNRFGSYEPCGCHTTPYGGLDRETNLLAEAKQKNNAVLYLDAGNMLVPPDLKAAVEVYQSRAEVIAEMLDKTGLTLFSPGPTDLKLGVSFLQNLAKKTKFSFISSNIQDEKGNLAFKPYQIINSGGVRIGILAVSAASEKGKSFQIQNWKDSLGKYLPEVQASSDVVVVLSQLKAEDADTLVKDYPQVALVIGGDEKLSLDSPNWMNKGKTILLDPGINGFSVGKLDWHIKLPFQGSYSQKEVDENVGKLAFYQEKLKASPEDVVVQQEIKYLTDIAPTKPVDGGSAYEHAVMKLTQERYGKTNEVTELMKNSKEKLKQYLIARSKKHKK